MTIAETLEILITLGWSEPQTSIYKTDLSKGVPKEVGSSTSPERVTFHAWAPTGDKAYGPTPEASLQSLADILRQRARDDAAKHRKHASELVGRATKLDAIAGPVEAAP